MNTNYLDARNAFKPVNFVTKDKKYYWLCLIQFEDVIFEPY